MDALAKGGVFLFEAFRLDRQARALFRRDEVGALVPMAIGSRALDVLGLLVGRAPDLVSRDELIAPGRILAGFGTGFTGRRSIGR
jgi:DNA-binding winged helix-turn-helix (wHTH) protein